MLSDKLEIFKATNLLVSMVLGNTRNISRDVKFAEWQDARNKANDALDMIYLINTEDDPVESASMLRQYLFLLYGVKNRIRLLSEEGYLSIGYKTRVLIQLDECSRQAENWKKYFIRKARIREQGRTESVD